MGPWEAFYAGIHEFRMETGSLIDWDSLVKITVFEQGKKRERI